jgi:crossover junction endodeoxyribonuclease RuvC
MVILGIDPGTAIVGWAIVNQVAYRVKLVAYGAITTPAGMPIDERLLIIHQELKKIIIKEKPDAVSIEDLFFATNAKTAIAVGQARGVILLTARLAKVPAVAYSPLAVKRAVTGDGKADKGQVQRMIKAIFSLKEVPKPDDAADAAAIALTHAYSYRLKGKWS